MSILISKGQKVNLESNLWSLQFSKKRTKKIQLYCYNNSDRIVFVRFLGELRRPLIAFQIYWPLDAWVNFYMKMYLFKAEKQTIHSWLEEFRKNLQPLHTTRFGYLLTSMIRMLYQKGFHPIVAPCEAEVGIQLTLSLLLSSCLYILARL